MIIGGAAGEGQGTGCLPVIGQDNQAVNAVDTCIAVEFIRIGSSGEDIYPVVFGRCAPSVGREGLVVIDDLVLSPIRIGGVIVAYLGMQGGVITGAPSEEVNPSVVVGCNLGVVTLVGIDIHVTHRLVAHIMVLLLGEAPSVGGRPILEVTRREEDFLGGADGDRRSDVFALSEPCTHHHDLSDNTAVQRGHGDDGRRGIIAGSRQDGYLEGSVAASGLGADRRNLFVPGRQLPIGVTGHVDRVRTAFCGCVNLHAADGQGRR